MSGKGTDLRALYVAVEVAVMMWKLLNDGDNYLPRYEYIDEAKDAVDFAVQDVNMDPIKLANKIAEILTHNLEHPYNEHSGNFLDIAKFILERVKHYHEYSMI